MPFKAMETVEAVVRLGSFTEAASELGLTQSAVSNSIRRFEQDLGLTLFTRRGPKVEPNKAAIDIAETMARARQLLQSKLHAMEGNKASDRVTIAIAPTLASRWLAPRLTELQAMMKPVRISVSSHVELTDSADIWIRNAKVGRWAVLTSKRLLSAVKAPVASPKLVGSNSVSDREVLSFPLLGVDARPVEWREWAACAGLPEGADPQFNFDVTASTWDAAIAGSGVALGDLYLLRNELGDGKLRQLGTTTLASYSYFLCRHRGDDRRHVMRVWEWLSSQRFS